MRTRHSAQVDSEMSALSGSENTPTSQSAGVQHSPSPTSSWIACSLAAVVVLGLWSWELGDAGISTRLEAGAYLRASGILGGAHTGLERGPFLPDWLRATCMQWLGPKLDEGGLIGLRLPGLVAAAALAAACVRLALHQGASWVCAALAACLVLALPGVALGARTATVSLSGEAFAAWMAIALLELPATSSVGRRLVLGGLALASGALASACSGVFLGAAVPLMASTLMLADASASRPRLPTVQWWRRAYAISAVGLVGTTAVLWATRDDGYIAFLGAVPRMDDDATWNAWRWFHAAAHQLGTSLHPWTGLLVAAFCFAGPLCRRWLVWLGVAWLADMIWMVGHDVAHSSIHVPVALVCATLIHDCTSSRSGSPILRRTTATLAALGALIIGKDAQIHAGDFARPWSSAPERERYLDEIGTALAAAEHSPALTTIAQIAMVAVPLCILWAPGTSTRPTASGRLREPSPARARWPDGLRSTLVVWHSRLHRQPRIRALRYWTAQGGLVLSLLSVAGFAGLQLHGSEAARSSSRSFFQPYEELRERGWVPDQLAMLGDLPDLVSVHVPPAVDLHPVAYRSQLRSWLAESDAQARAALVSRGDFPYVMQDRREGADELSVIAHNHEYFIVGRTVSSEWPKPANPLDRFVFTDRPQLRHETRLQFDQHIEVVGWEFSGPVTRGQKARLRLALRVLRRLPSSARIYARLQMGKMSRLNAKPHRLASDLYPPSYWRKGDFILHEFEFDVPYTAALPGRHDFIVALQRSPNNNLPISFPEGKRGPHGVRVRGKSRNFATIGQVIVH